MIKIDYLLLTAILLDLIIGDPQSITHPVIYIGRLISYLEKRALNYVKTNIGQRITGIVVVIIVVAFVYLFTFYIINFSYRIHFIIGIIINLYLLQSTIALKGLTGAGREVYKHLEKGNIVQAREAVNGIVARECRDLPESEIIRATVESLAENTSDGILAPIFFYILGGTPLAMAYKAVNTLDSMLGYKNDKYRYLGWASARLDDIVNLLPARITGICLALAAFLSRQDPYASFRIMWRDASKHPSPNAGYPEGAVAGALGLRLGGTNHYHGKTNFRAYLGDKKREFHNNDIKIVIKMIYWSITIFLAAVLVLDSILIFF